MSVTEYSNKIAIACDKNTNTLKFIGVLVDVKEKDNGIESATLYLINEKKYITVMNDGSTAITFSYWGNYNVELLSTMKNFKGKIIVNNRAELNTLMHYFQGGYHVDNWMYPVNVYIEGKYIRHIASIVIGMKDEFVNYPYFKMIEHFDINGYTICPINYDEHHDYATDYKITHTVDTIYNALGISNSSVEDSATKVEAMNMINNTKKLNINNFSLKDFHKKYSNDIDLKDYIPQEFVNYCQADVGITIDLYEQERISRLKSLIGKNVLVFDKNEELFIGLGVLDEVWKNYEDRWVCRVIYNSVDNNITPTQGIDFDTYYIDNIYIIEHDWDLINFKNYIPNCLIHITETYDYRVVHRLYYDCLPTFVNREGYALIKDNMFKSFITEDAIPYIDKPLPIFEIHNGNVSPKVYNYNIKTNSFIKPIIVHADFANNTKEENKMKLNFKTVDGKRFESYGKHNGKEIETITTVVDFMKNGQYFNGEATIDASEYDERQGILEALANAIYGNFDNVYDKYVKDRERKEKELCRCKVCGKWYNEVEDKVIPFTAEDARKHEDWHIENKKAKKERQRIRKEAEKRVSEIKREQEIEKLVQQMLDSDNV